jgi:hypothetical protein
MVESNNDEERFARIEEMTEALQRESFAFRIIPSTLVGVSVLPVVAIYAPHGRPAPIADRRTKRRHS